MLRQEILRRSSASLFSLQSSARRCLLVLSLLAGIWAVEGSVGSAQDPVDLVWQQTQGPVGGSARYLAVDPTTGSLFALNDHGFFRSTTDNGSWEKTLNVASWSTVIANPRTGAVFVGTLSSGLHRSVDRGATWAVIDSIALHGLPPSLALDPQGRLYMAFTSREGQKRISRLRRSADDGETWETLSFPDSVYVTSLLIHPDTGTLLAAAWYGHIYRSTDDGATWRRVTFVGSGQTGEKRLVVDPHTGQLFLIVKGWLFHSVNDGQTWGKYPHNSFCSHFVA